MPAGWSRACQCAPVAASCWGPGTGTTYLWTVAGIDGRKPGSVPAAAARNWALLTPRRGETGLCSRRGGAKLGSARAAAARNWALRTELQEAAGLVEDDA